MIRPMGLSARLLPVSCLALLGSFLPAAAPASSTETVEVHFIVVAQGWHRMLDEGQCVYRAELARKFPAPASPRDPGPV